MTKEELDAFIVQLDQKNEDEVRLNIINSVYSQAATQPKQRIAEWWLEKKERDRQDKRLGDAYELAKESAASSKISALAAVISALIAFVALFLNC